MSKSEHKGESKQQQVNSGLHRHLSCSTLVPPVYPAQLQSDLLQTAWTAVRQLQKDDWKSGERPRVSTRDPTGKFASSTASVCGVWRAECFWRPHQAFESLFAKSTPHKFQINAIPSQVLLLSPSLPRSFLISLSPILFCDVCRPMRPATACVPTSAFSTRKVCAAARPVQGSMRCGIVIACISFV